MLSKKNIGSLKNIVGRCDRIEEILGDISLDEFMINEDKLELVSFNLLQIGEIVGKLDEDFYNKYRKIPWIQIKSMRNRIAHGYDSIDVDIVWQTAKDDCHELKKYCLKILNENE